ncbi:MAG: DUF1338 family protein [Pseudonocardiales bacterium]
MRFWSAGELRAAFAQLMAATYGREVPAYNTLVDVAAAVNADVLTLQGASAERLGSIGRVSAERHGAIRVGTPAELREVARVFGALGMCPVGFYDLRDARSAVPVISTAFRPTDSGELAANPFRMFTSMLVTDDRRFFSADLQGRLDAFLARRTLFPAELITLSDKAILADGLVDDDAERFLKLATAAFALAAEPVDQAWYAELEAVSAVAADIGGVTSTHINHLTPRVLDIDELYRRMSAHGIKMIDSIQGPPRWDGPDVLLRQTSFRALAEQRLFRGADGSVAPGSLRVRFGEVEARGIALTPAGRDHYDSMMAEIDRVVAGSPGALREDVAATVWARNLPSSELGLLREGLGFFTYSVADSSAFVRGADPVALVQAGALRAEPIVYEDFLPRSAAGIFQSNLSTETTWDAAQRGTRRDAGWLSDVLGEQVPDPTDLYAAQQAKSLDRALARLRLTSPG